jgi:hypothetical protein
MQYELAGELYTSKAAIERHYRATVTGRPEGFVFDQDHPDFAFLHAVLMHHDRRREKIGHARVKEFFVKVLPGSARGVWIRRWDGSETDVSLLKVITATGMGFPSARPLRRPQDAQGRSATTDRRVPCPGRVGRTGLGDGLVRDRSASGAGLSGTHDVPRGSPRSDVCTAG